MRKKRKIQSAQNAATGRKWKSLQTGAFIFISAKTARSLFKAKINAYSARTRTRNVPVGVYNEKDKLQIVQKPFMDDSDLFCASDSIFNPGFLFSTICISIFVRIIDLSNFYGSDYVYNEQERKLWSQ